MLQSQPSILGNLIELRPLIQLDWHVRINKRYHRLMHVLEYLSEVWVKDKKALLMNSHYVPV